jgi:ABC-type sugar transport system permease subunit
VSAQTSAIATTPRRASWATQFRRAVRHGYLPYLYLLPSLIVIIGIIAIPIGKAILMSFQEYSFLKPTQPFVGLRNYLFLLLDDDVFWQVILNTVYWTVVGVALNYAISMGVALLLNHKLLRLRQFFRGLVLIPWVVPAVVVALVFRTFFDPYFGLFNAMLREVGVVQAAPKWLADPYWAMPALILVALWKYSPFFIIGLLAGLQAIPEEMYDAAKVDGAGHWQTFWHITFPQLLPISTVLLVLGTIWRANHFDLIWLLTGGGPGNRTLLTAPYAYRTAITDFKPGLAAAISVLAAAFLMVFILMAIRRMLATRM